MPISMRRTNELAIAWRAIEDGCSSITTKLQAEIMKRPRQAASIRYSGQWLVRAVLVASNQRCPLALDKLVPRVSFAASISSCLPMLCMSVIRCGSRNLVTNTQQISTRKGGEESCNFPTELESDEVQSCRASSGWSFYAGGRYEPGLSWSASCASASRA